MAAPPCENGPLVVSLSAEAEEQPRQHQETIGEGADPESAVPIQLIAKTTSLTISGLGSEPDESVGSPASPASRLAEMGHPQPPSLLALAQPYPATMMERRREDASGTASAAAPALALASPFRQMLETRFRSCAQTEELGAAGVGAVVPQCSPPRQLLDLPNEALLQILSYLEVCDLLATSRTSHHLRALSLAPYLHHLRLRRTRALLPPLLTSPARPSLADLIRRSVFLTHTTFASRRLARSLASIRLARQLAARPSAEALVQRCVLPPECLPSAAVPVAPALVARKRAVEKEKMKDGLRAWVGSVWTGEVRLRERKVVEKERVKDGLRAWVGSVWTGEVRLREEGMRRWEERAGVGRVWRLRRFWERVGRGEV